MHNDEKLLHIEYTLCGQVSLHQKIFFSFSKELGRNWNIILHMLHLNHLDKISFNFSWCRQILYFFWTTNWWWLCLLLLHIHFIVEFFFSLFINFFCIHASSHIVITCYISFQLVTWFFWVKFPVLFISRGLASLLRSRELTLSALHSFQDILYFMCICLLFHQVGNYLWKTFLCDMVRPQSFII